MSARVFISHSSKDRKIAGTICLTLESRGLDCWIAARDVPPGENFMEAIVSAIRGSKVMVLVFTGNANNSDEVKREVVLASQSKVVLIPVRVEDIMPNDALAYQFATRQWIDLFDDWERQIERLIVSINTIVAADPSASHSNNAGAGDPSRADPNPHLESHHASVPSVAAHSVTLAPDQNDKPDAENVESPRTMLGAAAMLLLLQAMVRAGFALNVLSGSSRLPGGYLLLMGVIPLVLAAATAATGFLMIRAHAFARPIGLAICSVALAYQVVGLMTGLVGGYNLPPLFWGLLVFNTAVSGFALMVLLRWRRP